MRYRWSNDKLPTRFIPERCHHITVHDDKKITYCEDDQYFYDYENTTAKEFLQNECVVIFRDGNATVALDKTTGNKAVARCCPEDTYDFMTGAKLAFDRLTGEKKPLVKEVSRIAEVGEYVKVVKARLVSYTNGKPDYKNGDIFKIVGRFGEDGLVNYDKKGTKVIAPDEYVVLEGYQPPQEDEPHFSPYLEMADVKMEQYGCIGDSTPISDVVGRKLHVGDVVELYNKNNVFCGECPVVKRGKCFVMGIRWSCKSDGTITDDYKIVLKRKHYEVENGEIVEHIRYVKERGAHNE